MCWNRINATNWVKLDDNNVEPAVLDQILELEGGGDYHSSYLMMWQRKTL